MWDPTVTVQLQAQLRTRASRNRLQSQQQRARHQVPLIQRYLPGAFTRGSDLDSWRTIDHFDTELIAQVIGQSRAVECRAQVGATCRDSDLRALARAHAASTNPRARAAACTSTGTTIGSPAPSSAHCGSLRPLPVNVHTIV